MLCITKKTGYGLVALTRLAKLDDGDKLSARQIAEQYDVPVSLLMNVLKELSSAGVVESTRGAKGGYRLARSPEEISLRDLIVTLEGPIRLAECIKGQTHSDEACRIMDNCPIADPVHKVNRRISDFLKDVTLSEIVRPSGGGIAPSAEV